VFPICLKIWPLCFLPAYPASFPAFLEPFAGVMPGLKCFIAAVIGGIGNVTGAVIGGLILGVMEILIVFFAPELSGYKDAFAFVALIIILLVRPTGLMGEAVTDKV